MMLFLRSHVNLLCIVTNLPNVSKGTLLKKKLFFMEKCLVATLTNILLKSTRKKIYNSVFITKKLKTFLVFKQKYVFQYVFIH